MSTNIFNPQRQYLFVQRQFSLFQQRWAIAAAVIFGLMLIISIFHALFITGNPTGIRGNYNGFFFIGGIILTSPIFKELHYPNRSYSFLSLPASTLEKLIGSWLLTSPLYIIVFTLISFVIYLISLLIAGAPFAFSNFFTESYGDTISNYLVIQTIFLWGACYFRKNNLLKTLLSIIMLFIAVAIYTVLLKNLFFGPGGGFVVTVGDFQVYSEEFKNTFVLVMKFLFSALGPYMLLVSYYTLKERQV
jgi:hypothetical protein